MCITVTSAMTSMATITNTLICGGTTVAERVSFWPPAELVNHTTDATSGV